MTKLNLGFTAALVAAIAVLMALPAAAADNGFYLGGSVGQAAINTGDLGEIQVDGDSTGYKVFGGVRMLTFLAIEGSYRDLGDVTVEKDATNSEFSMTGYDVQAMGMLPLGIADLFVKAGMIQWDAELSGAVNGVPEKLSTDGTDPVYGVGFQFRIQSFAIRGEVEYFDVESTDHLYMYSIGGSYTF